MSRRTVFYAYMPRTNATARQRAHLVADGLRLLGEDVRVEAPLSETGLARYATPDGLSDRIRWGGEMLSRRLPQVLRHPGGAVAVVQRELLPVGPPYLERLLARRARALVLDLDDAVHRSSENRAHSSLGRRLLSPGKIEAIAAAADAVVCGNEHLAEEAHAAGARRVLVVPTCVEFGPEPDVPVPAEDGTLRLTWLGNAGNLHLLASLAPALALAERSGVALELTVMSSRPPTSAEAGGRPLRFEPWSLAAEEALLLRTDVGVMPLPDDAYSRGKCGFKILRYAAAAVPAIASPVGVNARMIEDGASGLLASTPEEWADAIVRAAYLGPEGRCAMGRAAREKLRREFAIERAVEAWRSLLEEL